MKRIIGKIVVLLLALVLLAQVLSVLPASAGSASVSVTPNPTFVNFETQISVEDIVLDPGHTMYVRVTRPDGGYEDLGFFETNPGQCQVSYVPTVVGTHTAWANDIWYADEIYYGSTLGYMTFEVLESAPPQFLVTQGTNSWVVEPIEGTVSAEEFYDYSQFVTEYVPTMFEFPGTGVHPLGGDPPVSREIYGTISSYETPADGIYHGITISIWHNDVPVEGSPFGPFDTDAYGHIAYMYYFTDVNDNYDIVINYPGEDNYVTGGRIVYLSATAYPLLPAPPPASPAPPYYEYTGSGHTPYMEATKSKVYLYEDPEGGLSLIMHHGCAYDSESPEMGYITLLIDGLPEGAFWSVADDQNEVGPSDSLEGYWYKEAGCSDGGVISGLTGDWTISIYAYSMGTVEPGVTAWEYQADPTTAYTLDMDTYTWGPVTIRPTAALGSLTVTNFVQWDENDPTTIPVEPWSYVFGQGEFGGEEFTLAATGEDSQSFTLAPGEYWIAQTHKAAYDTSIYVDENDPVEADWTSVTIVAGEETQVAFVNALEGQFYGSYTLPELGSDSGDLDFTIPTNRPVPIQAAWDVDLWGDNGGLKIDLVTGKPIQILVNLAPTVPIVGHADIHVDITDANGVIVNSYDKPVSKADYDVAKAKVFILTNPITLSTGFYTVSGSYTVDDTAGDTLTSVPVAVMNTVPLALYYTTLSRSDYGTEPGAAYGEMVQQSNDFVKATFPLNLNTLKSDTGWKTPISGSKPQPKPKDPLEKGMSIDCTNIALAAYNAYGKSGISYRGIGIGPMVAGLPDYFTYHGRPGAGGIRFAGIKGVVVLDGVWDGVAHELGHTYGLFVPPGDEQYLMPEYQPHGKTASGVAVEAGTWATGYDFMSWSHDRNVDGTWVNHQTYEDLFKAMLSSQTPQDPQVLWASGVIYMDPIDGVKMETDTDDFPWYRYLQGYADELDPNGDFALIFKDALEQPIGDPTRFAAYYTMQIDPAFRVGQDINLENFGTVPIGFAPFAFATPLPTGTDHVEVYEGMKSQPTYLGEVDMENVEPFKYSSSGLSIKNGDKFKSGTTVPIKFQLWDAEANVFITTATATCEIGRIVPGQQIVFQPARSGAEPKNSNLFRYDKAKNNYIFNWDTRGLAKGDWRVKVEVNDGHTFIVDVKIQ